VVISREYLDPGVFMGEEVAKLSKQVDYMKELDEAMVFFIAVTKDAKAGKSAAEIGAAELPKFLAAIQGIDQMDDEIAQDRKVALQTIGYRLGELIDALLGKSVAPAIPKADPEGTPV
jgi:hypothetical protein